MFKRIISLTVSLGLLLQQTVFAYTASLNLSGYLNQGPNLTVSDRFRPVNLRYFSYQPLTNDFKILLDKGDTKDIADTNLKGSASVLLDYFKIGLSLPNDKFWVNLRPDSEDQIIDDELAKTDLGKVMLEADLKLKQDTALFTSPKTPLGKAYWDKLYKKAGELFGTENITIPTLTRPWIVPGEIILRESADKANNGSGAYIYKANLKVMLEEDYLKSSQLSAVSSQQYEFNDPRLKELNQYSTQLIRELILPRLTQKVNSSKDYANLRQVYFSLILARWFKESFRSQRTENRKQSTEKNSNYVNLIDSKDLSSLTSKQAWDKTTYFNAYQKSFKEGEYNLSEPVYTPTGQVIRRYMSGGESFGVMPIDGLKINSSPIVDDNKDKVLLNNKLNIQKPRDIIRVENEKTAVAASAITVEPEIAYDSRGKKTVAVTLRIDDIEARGDVPAGASKGEDEARTVGADAAIKNIKDIIAPLILEEIKKGRDLRKHVDLLAIEKAIIDRAGNNYQDLGADAVVPVSRALWVLAAKLHNMELWQYIREFEPEAVFDNPNIVFPYMNIYNGGLHAAKTGEKLGKDRIDFQEIMIVPSGAKSQKEALEMGDKIDFNLKQILSEKFALDKITRADEAGFSVKGLGSSDEAIEHVFKAIERAGYKPGVDVKLALDTAATSFYNKELEKYEFQGKMLSSNEMINYYVNLARKYAGKIISIEDGLAENDWDGWTKLTQAMEEFGVLTIGDDNFVTQLERLEKGIEKKAARAILIKVNQNGSMSGTLEVIKRAKKAGFVCIVSHRSGETLDTTIADLAYAVKAFGLKTGDPQPAYDFGPGGEYADRALVRRVKYERMVENEKIAAAASAITQEKTTSSAIEETKKFAGDKFAPVYYFGNYGESDVNLPKGGAKDKELLGGKGANLAEMANYISEQYPELGLNVPPGFTITTEQTKNWNARKKVLSDELMREMRQAIHKLEKTMGRKLGDIENLPLLVAVRSGAKKSMPGMMDTILNLGLNDKSVLALARATNERFAWDCYRRLFEMYGRTVLGVKEDDEKRTGFKHILEEMVARQAGRKDEYGLNVAELKELVELYKQEIQRQGLPAMPEDPYEQYRYAVEAVFRSSYNDRAMTYRVKEGLKLEETLSAVNVMPMVFGNLNDNSGAGVAFSRNLQNGERKITVEYNINCQGEDVVSGRKKGLSFEELEKRFPEAARSLKAILEFLELHYKDVQDVEFTIENGKLWILQARSAKRTSRAEVKTAMDMYAEGLLKTPEEVDALITPDKMAELLVSQFDKKDKKKAVNEERLLSDGGLDASPGAGVGRIVFDSDRAKELKEKIDDIIIRIKNNGEVTPEEKELARVGIILVRDETSPEDLDGMLASVGIWTKKGGRTSHAAVVARQFGIAAVVGDENIEIDVAAKTVTVTKADGSKQVLSEGEIVSLDGTGEKGRGQIFIGEIKTTPSFVTTAQYKESLGLVKNAVKHLEQWKKNITGEHHEALRREYDKHIKIYQEHIAKYEQAQLTQDEWDFYRQYQTLNQMANKVRKERGGLGVGGNAEKPLDVLNAILNGAENFGLVRTEHMFSGDGRELKVQKMILAKTKQKREEALRELLPLQQVDFEQIFIFADGRPVTIRLIDPPLHEFLPKKEEKIQELADALGLDIQEVKSRIDALHEDNPMFGVRGVRLSVLFPEIIEMQVNAIFNAVNKARAAGIQVEPQIMVPLVGNVKEFLFAKQRIEKVAGEAGVKRDSFQIGTMIEIVAGAINIAEIAREAEFISFGTNDLTQGTLKISRDDGKEWLRKSLAAEIFEDDPFEALSPEVALFIKRVIEQARAANPKIKIGICGEQGVNVKSIEKYLAPYGLNYVSGGSRRIPGALMAAAKESVKGYKPLEPKVREEVKIEKKEFPELTSIKGAKDSHGQFREAVAYVRQKGHTIEAKKAALANIDLTKSMWKDMVKNAWGDLPVVGDYDEVISWAKELKDMVVTIRVDKSEEKTGPMVGMIEMEPLLFNNGELRFEIQELLLDNEISEQKRQNKMEIFKKAFVSYLKYTTAKSWEFSVKLPDFALGTIFEYETKQDQEAAIKNLAASLKIEEKEIEARIAQYREANRAIGTRGMRAFFLRNVAPLYAAMSQAALNAAKENGIKNVDFILPFLVNGKELKVVLDGYMTDKGETIVSSLRESLKEVEGAEGVNYRFGAVIETPAACVTAEDLAKYADFLVVDAKKLTEAVWAAFEGDTRKGFFDAYRANGIWESDIFKYAPLETRLLIQEAVSAARAQKNNLEIRVITDSQDADLIELSQNLRVNSLIVGSGEDDFATLAAAQAAIKYPGRGVSSSLVKTEAVKETPAKAVGGIDFRQMNMLIQPQGSFASSSLDFSLPALSKAEIESFDLDQELAAIQKMASSGIAPSDERLKEYLAVCFAQERTGREIDSLKLCLLDVFEQQQLEAKETPNGYKEVLVIADTRGYVLKEGRLAASKQNSYSLN